MAEIDKASLVELAETKLDDAKLLLNADAPTMLIIWRGMRSN